MKKLLLVIFVFLLILPGTLAAITDVSFLFHDTPLELVGTRMEMPVNMIVSLDNLENKTSLVGDLRELNGKPSMISILKERKFNCTPQIDNKTNKTTSTQCQTKLDIIVNNPTVNLTFNITTNKTVQENYTYTFTIDDTNPELTAISSQFKINNNYIVASAKPTEIYFDINDTIGTFNLRNVYMMPRNGMKTRMLNCSGNTRCTGLYVATCNPGEFVQISLASPSTDDAGNQIIGIPRRSFKCDALAPKMKKDANGNYDIRLGFDNSIYPQPKSGDTITVSAFIEEDASGVNAFLNASNVTGQKDLQAGDCKLYQAGIYNCTWTLTNILEGDNKLSFFIKDGVGRKLQVDGTPVEKLDYDIHIDHFEKANTNETPQFFRPVIATIPASEGYNRVAVDLAEKSGFEYPLFATYKLERLTSGGSIEALHTDIDPYACMLKNGNETVSARQFFSDIAVNDPLSAYDKTNRVNFILSPGANVNDLEDSFDILCNLTVIVRENDRFVYEKPTNVLFESTIKFRNSALGDDQPGEHFAKKIQKKEKELNGFWKFIGTMNQVVATLSDVCNLDKTLAGFGSKLVGAQIAGTALSSIAPTVSNLEVDKIQTMVDKRQSLNSPAGILGKGSVLKKLMDFGCQWSHCSLDANAKKTNSKDWLWGGETKASKVFKAPSFSGKNNMASLGNDAVGELFENVNVPNSQESIVAAVQTRCLPAIMYHLNQYREIDCNELICMKQQAVTGMDVGVCAMTKAESICENVVGEAFELPFLRQSKNLMDNANAFTQELLPNTLKFVTNNFLCKDVDQDYFAPGNGQKLMNKFGRKAVVFACNLPESISTQLNMITKTASSADQFQYPKGNDVCAQALCNDPDPTKCVKSASWLAQELNVKIPGTGLRIEPNVQTYTISDFKNLLDSYGKENDPDKKTKLFKKMKSVGLVKPDFNENQFSSSERKRLLNKLEIQQHLANGNKDAQVSIDEKGEMYLSNIRWDEYYKAQESLNSANEEIRKECNENTDLCNYIHKKIEFENLDAEYKQKLAVFNKKKKDERTTTKEDLAKAKDAFTKAKKDFEKKELEVTNAEKELGPQDLETAKTLAVKKTAAKKEFDKQSNDFKENLDSEIKRLNKLKSDNKCDKACKNQIEKLGTLKNQLSEGNTALKEYATHQHNLQTSRNTYAQIERFSDSVTSILLNTGILNYGVLSNYGRNTVFGKVSQWSDTNLNSKNLIQGICSPKSKDISRSADAGGMGGAVQCVDGQCRPVLMQAAEKVRFNSSHILYTLVYALGPVAPPNGISNKEPFKYNIILKTASGLDKKKLFSVDWKNLTYGLPETYSGSFVSKNDYTEICIHFSEKYPPNEWGAKTTYCRPIMNASTGSTYFDTGSPVGSNFADPKSNGGVGNIDPNTISEDI